MAGPQGRSGGLGGRWEDVRVLSDRADRLRALIDTVVDAFDDPVGGGSLARRAHLSRFHFDRLVAGAVGEPPAALRRRLLLERAAWRLLGGETVTATGIEAGYGSTEAFSRAFARAHGVAPSRFAAARGDFRVPAPNGIHFHPPAGLRLHDGEARAAEPMDLTDRLIEHDRWLTARLLERAAELPGDALDRAVRPGHVVLPFDGPEPSVRAMLDALVRTKEVWWAAMAGAEPPDGSDRTLAGLRRRCAASGAAFADLARRVRDRGEWDDVFVDALCDPPQSFTYGGAIAHVITFSAHRREVLAAVLAELNGRGAEPGCPIEWERMRAAERAHEPAVLRGTER